MKKIVCLFLATAISMTFFGCSKPKQKTNDDIKNDSSKSTETSNSSNETSSLTTSLTSSKNNSQNETDDKNSSTGSKNSQQSVSSNVENNSSSVSKKENEIVKVTFPEGTTLPKMFMILEQKGVAKQDDLFAEAAKFNINSFEITSGINTSKARCFKLEGYLFPDTYDFFVGETPTSILKKMVSNSQKRLSSLKSQAAKTGLSFDEIMILASIIQKETGNISEQKNVSSVLFNRLKAKMKLQCDPTITYVEGAIKPFITGDKNRFNTAYNTYKCPALPAGPICNPGLSAILAALNPAKTDFLYFAMDKNNTHYYAKTLAQHNENCKKGNINTGIG